MKFPSDREERSYWEHQLKLPSIPEDHQYIFSETIENETICRLRKQDIKLGIEMDSEKLQLVKEVLQWVKLTSLTSVEADLAMDIISKYQQLADKKELA